MIFEDDETLRMYVEESLEHLADIENDLLSIEETGADIDEDLVNNVFRAAHSIKGGAGFMGLSNIKELSHRIENILGMIRSRELVPTSEIVSSLLKAFDKLGEMINNVENSNDMDVSDYLDKLVALTTESLPEDKKESVSNIIEIALPNGVSVFRVPQIDLDQAKKEGKILYLVEYDLIHDIQQRNKKPLDVLNALLNSGTIIESMVDLNAVGTLDGDAPVRIPFFVLFASIIEPEIISALFDVEEKYVKLISDDMIGQPLPKQEAEPVSQIPVEREMVEPPPQVVHPVTEVAQPTVEPEEQSPKKIDTPAVIETKKPKKTESISKEESSSPHKATQTSLRVNVSLLDSLMTLAGELVLSRNQLIQGISANSVRAMELSGQRINMVTSELQEAIMRTRMQSIANVFNKYPRVVRDLARDLNKEVDLSIEGKEVELDKTIIEAISDPLTHLVRNSVDHGIEPPAIRSELKKDPVGKVRLRAYHEAGQVNIEIADDGRGLDGEKLAASAIKKGLISEQQASLMSEKERINLIFLPGFSTAKEITDVSGRGVGMDVVKTNLDKLGGIVDIDSQPGHGTTINIKLPLTLAIIPSQIICVGEERYAIPQVNLNELLRIPANQVQNRIEKVGDADVVRLRGNLLPLLNLSDILEIERTYVHPEDGKRYPEKRVHIADRRSKTSPLFNKENTQLKESLDEELKLRESDDRRYHAVSAINIAVVSTGTFVYGLVVDKLMDSEEIVVKPLGRHLKNCSGYAGATIMGDGKVALILDVTGLAAMANLTSMEGSDRVAQMAKEKDEDEGSGKDRASWLLFRNAPEDQYAVPLSLVERIERIKVPDIEEVGGRRVIQYRGGTLPLVSLDQVANVKPLPEKKQYEVIVFNIKNREVGLLATPPVDALEVALQIDEIALKQIGIMGSAIVNKLTTLLVDIFEVVRTLNPEWFDLKALEKLSDDEKDTILFAEDSAFFRSQVKGYLEDSGFNVIDAEDGIEAWELLETHEDEVDIVLTDIEMPNMNGFELTLKIKADERFNHLNVIALTSLAGDDDIARGEKVGIDDYQIKLDKERMLASVRSFLKKKKKAGK